MLVCIIVGIFKHAILPHYVGFSIDKRVMRRKKAIRPTFVLLIVYDFFNASCFCLLFLFTPVSHFALVSNPLPVHDFCGVFHFPLPLQHQGISLCSYENMIAPSSQVTRLTCPSLPSLSFKLCVALLDPAHFSLCYKEINQITPLVNPSFLYFLCQNENYVIEASANHRLTRFSPIFVKFKADYSQIWALREYELLQCDISQWVRQ